MPRHVQPRWSFHRCRTIGPATPGLVRRDWSTRGKSSGSRGTCDRGQFRSDRQGPGDDGREEDLFLERRRGVQEGETLSSEDDNRGVEVSGDGSHLLTWNGSPGKVIVWDFKTRKCLHLLEGIDFSVYHAGFSPDGRLVLANGSPKPDTLPLPMVAQFWEVATGRPVGIRMRWQSRWIVGTRFHPGLLPA